MIDSKHNMLWNINSSIHKNKSIVRWNINGEKLRCIIPVGLLVLVPIQIVLINSIGVDICEHYFCKKKQSLKSPGWSPKKGEITTEHAHFFGFGIYIFWQEVSNPREIISLGYYYLLKKNLFIIKICNLCLC